MIKMKILNKDKSRYLVVFCIKEGLTYKFEKIVHIKPNTKLIKYGKEDLFIVDIENPTYRRRNTQYYCIDINSKQVHMKNENNEEILDGNNEKVLDGNIKLEELQQSKYVSSRITKAIFMDKVIEQLAHAATKPVKQTYDYKALVIGLIIGGLICFIVGILLPFNVVY